MTHFFRLIALCCLFGFLFLTLTGIAQKRPVSYEQVFGHAKTDIFKPLPAVVKWLDENRIVTRTPSGDGGQQTSVVDIAKASVSPYKGLESSAPAPPVTKVPAVAKNYQLSPGGQYAAYTFNNDLYMIDVRSGEISRITNDGSDSVLNGHASWVYYEEIFGRNYRAFWWSDDSRYIVFMRFDERSVPVFPIYVAKGQHGYLEKQRFPKAGDSNPKIRIGIYRVAEKKLVWADFDENDDQYFRIPYFTPANELWVQWVNRRQDTLRIFRIDTDNGKKRQVYEETQSTWVTQNDPVYFLPDGKQFITRSDKSGWSHYYLYTMDGHAVNQITSGNYNVGYIAAYDSLQRKIFFTARKENSARTDLYSAEIDGKNFKRITTGAFSYSDISISPRMTHFTATYSNVNTPSAAGVFTIDGKLVIHLGSVSGNDFSKYNHPQKELLRTSSSDGLFDLPFTITYPVNFDKRKKYPVIMNVYGGPYRSEVMDAWNTSLTDIWWAQEGIIQVTADNRGSWHFGKEGLNHIYRQAGKYEIEDFMAIGKWLKQQPWIDTARLCIIGYSHGGYMACMGLTYGSDVFNYGIAFWPAIDWHLSDTYYTERYMDLPQNNPEGYKQWSVLHHAGKYKGMLRIVHGSSDDNTHLQNTLQLIDTLQNLNKAFELMIYPGSRHGLKGAKWKHNKMETYRFYYQYLLNRKMPRKFLQ